MKPVHIVLIVLIVALGLTVPAIVSDVARPQLTDPIAQRIWAASHGNVSMDCQEVSAIVEKATYADSVVQNRKK